MTTPLFNSNCPGCGVAPGTMHSTLCPHRTGKAEIPPVITPFAIRANLAWGLKHTIHAEPRWEFIDPAIKEASDGILTALSCILTTDKRDITFWEAIEDYAICMKDTFRNTEETRPMTKEEMDKL